MALEQISLYQQQKITSLKRTTLTFLHKPQAILLAMKKRGFGQGKWNGIGGKTEGHETIEETATRELQEEIGVIPRTMIQVAHLTFFYPYNPNFDQEVHVYIIKSWIGEPHETKEMRPQWFSVNEIPYHHMWPDDKFWLPRVLQGELIKASFLFDKEETILEHHLESLHSFLK